jgi:MraZ protein
MTEFFGSFSGTLDAKNRLHVPIRLRQAADDSLDTCYLTLGLGGAVYLLPKEEWRRLSARFENYSNSNNVDGPAVHRVFVANTYEVTLDRQSRVQLPQELATKVGFQKEVKILGYHRRIEIWPAEKYDERMQHDERTYEEKATKLFQ